MIYTNLLCQSLSHTDTDATSITLYSRNPGSGAGPDGCPATDKQGNKCTLHTFSECSMTDYVTSTASTTAVSHAAVAVASFAVLGALKGFQW